MPIPITAVFDMALERIVITPPATGWPPGRIAIVLLDGGSGLIGLRGEQVVASPAFFFTTSTTPVSNCVMPAPDCTSASPLLLTVPQAIALENLRLALDPLLAGLEAQGIARAAVPLAWTFTVAP
jgi:hypothetical protein